ncbi:LPXTG cell wall anchor domain-containing protein [Peptostreptococcus porci]
MPQTGGIGTIIFAVAGLALMGFAAYAIKRNSKED